MKKKLLTLCLIFTLGFGLILASGSVFAEEPTAESENEPTTEESVDQPAASSDETAIDQTSDSTETSDDQNAVNTEGNGNVSIYRLYMPSNGEHLYTTDVNEVNVLVSQHGWAYEGVGWYAPASGTPVYRLYNAGLQNHLYTTDTNEVNVLTAYHGWSKDNNGNPLFYSGGDIAVYRLYNVGLRGLHHLTTDRNEYDVLPSHGWTQEGTALYAAARGNSNALPAGASTIENTSSLYTIEADVTLRGSGTGYHAKLIAATPTAAVSFGIQFDQYGAPPYTNQTAFLIENVASNSSGGQTYTRTGVCNQNQTYHLMLAVQSDGRCDVYVSGIKVGSVSNSQLSGQPVYLRVEGSGRKNGDTVNASFSNIHLKGSGNYNADKHWGTHNFDTNAGIHSNVDRFQSDRYVSISGNVTGLSAEQDWDNAYGIVSGITQFVE